MASIELRLNRNDLVKTLPNLKQKLTKDAVSMALVQLGNEFIIQIQLNAPRKTGDYANSWNYLVFPQSIRIKTAQGALAEILEFGTSAHIIEGNPILSWIGPDGNRLFAHFVNHPGTPAFPHIRPTIEYVNSKIPTVLKQVLRELNI